MLPDYQYTRLFQEKRFSEKYDRRTKQSIKVEDGHLHGATASGACEQT